MLYILAPILFFSFFSYIYSFILPSPFFSFCKTTFFITLSFSYILYMTMSPHSTSVSKLEDPEDLLLSYLNADCLDTTNATSTTLDIINTKPPLSPSSASFDNPFSSHPSYQSSWPSMPFLFNVNALATVCMESPDLTAGISPRSISRLGSPFSSPDMPKSMTCFTSSYAAASHLADVKDYQPSTIIMSSSSLSSSPTISTASSVSSSDADEPKRKRERKKQLQRGPSSSSPPKHQQPPTMMHSCKPILPAASNSHHHLPSPPSSSLTNVKPEPMNFDTSSILTTLSDHSNSRGDTPSTLAENRPPSSKKYHDQQQCHDSIRTNDISPPRRQQKPAATDAQNKRQERLIKNRAAALLSRKRKREHLQALEQERQWLTKDNGLLKSKTAALEEKVQQLEKENQHQKQRYLLLQQQHQQKIQLSVDGDDAFGFASSRSSNNSDDDDNKSTISMVFSPQPLDPLSKVTNVLMILLISFALLTLPVASDRQDKDTQSFSSNNGNEKNMSSLYLPLVLHQQQQRLCSHDSADETTDMDINKDLDCQFTTSSPSPASHRTKIEHIGTAIIDSDHMHMLPSLPSTGKRKRTSA
ncbi:unnamed protein product [Absidia cylindrospora]